jgi:hypothetical protein
MVWVIVGSAVGDGTGPNASGAVRQAADIPNNIKNHDHFLFTLYTLLSANGRPRIK